MFLLKQCSYQIYIPLSHIFNLSFSTGKFPSKMKTAKVIPIHKGGDTSSPDNYRPISLLSSFSKILEKIFSNRFTDYLEFNKIISESQFGFRKGHSTAHPMVLLDNFVSDALNEKRHTIAVFCDLRKAFDTVNHGILIKKLKRCGVAGLALSWLKSYLVGRQQYVFFNDCASSLLEISLGVPQGSILGPLLFLIYINDLPNISALKTFLFADDATLLASHSDPVELCRIINIELKKVTDFFRANLLAIHPEKTKFILFTQSRNLDQDEINIYIDNNNADQVFNPVLKNRISRVSGDSEDPAIRFLGLYLDPQLNYRHHVQQIIKKVSSALFVMRKVKNLLTKKALTLLYYSLVHSHIIYAIQIWSSCPTLLLNKIFKLQKQAIRIINSAPYNAHTEPLFKESKILPLPDLIAFFRIQFMQQFTFGLLPPAFTSTWTTVAARNSNLNLHSYPLRNSDNLYIPISRLTSLEKHPLYLLPNLWANFNDPIKHIRNKIEFNFKLKTFYLSNLKSTVICSRHFCPSCQTHPPALDSE